MAFSPEERQRYARHLDLPGFGARAQERLRAGRVMVVGCGGLGSPALYYLAAAGVGLLGLVDSDQVEIYNLQRQILHATPDIGRPKVEAAAERLHALNPHVVIEPIRARLTAETAEILLSQHDVIADGCDNFRTRSEVNRAAVRLGIPLVSAAIGPFEGQLGVFAGHLPDQPCYACFAGLPQDVPGTSCADIGVLGAVAGLIGAAQALEVLRLIAGFGESRIGTLWLHEALGVESRTVRVRKDPRCPVCG